jgi:hypothetical protein
MEKEKEKKSRRHSPDFSPKCSYPSPLSSWSWNLCNTIANARSSSPCLCSIVDNTPEYQEIRSLLVCRAEDKDSK